MANNGEQQICFFTKEGHRKNMRCQKTGVTKMLASVSRICSYGHKVVFQAGKSYIEDASTGERSYLREKDGLYMLDAWVPFNPTDGAASAACAGFGRRGS